MITDPTVVNQFLIPFVVGVVIPFLTNWTSARGLPTYIETCANIALSAIGSAIVTITFDGDWQHFLLAFGIAWVGALRSHYLGAAQALYSSRPKKGRHELPDEGHIG